jgi:hypothetical protein
LDWVEHFPSEVIVGFRSERDADRYRIDVLEDEVAEKDDEIARLRAKLATPKPKRRQHKQKQQAKRGEVPRVADLPSGPRMEIATSDPKGWLVGLLWLAMAGGGYAYSVLIDGYQQNGLLVLLFFALPGLLFFTRTRLLLDREARTITVVYSLLISMRRVLSVKGKALRIEKRYHKPKDGDSYYAGHIFLGDHKLARAKIGKAQGWARRIAAFMELPLSERNESTKAIMRRAGMPLWIVGVVMVGGFLFLAATMLLAR